MKVVNGEIVPVDEVYDSRKPKVAAVVEDAEKSEAEAEAPAEAVEGEGEAKPKK